MQRVITVSLNRNAFHFEEDAHRRLKAYLDDAARALERSPDRAEVLADIEQAIADQCRRRLEAGRTVITLAELDPALAEIGPVEIPVAGPAPEGAAAVPGAANPARPGIGLQQVSEGALISGVCNGLARSAGLDVTLVRVIAVLLLFVTGGAMILLYAVLMLLIPFAPLAPQGPPLRWLPAKCREVVLAIRSRLAAITG
jgi:phage shock protein PspC (stress-responsive transcriptional regulator)